MNCNDCTDCDVLVVGGGLAGLAASLALAAAGAQVSLCDAAAKPQSNSDKASDPRVTTLSASSVQMLEALNIDYDFKTAPIVDMQVGAGHLNARHLNAGHLNAGHLNTSLFNGVLSFKQVSAPNDQAVVLAYIVPNQALQAALFVAAQEHPNITLQYGVRVDDVKACEVHDAHVQVILNDKTHVNATLLVAADGRNSQIRQRLGIKTYKYDYGASALVTNIMHTMAHQQTAYQFFRAGGPLASLPLFCVDGQYLSSLVWTEKSAMANALNELTHKELIAELEYRLDGLLGDIKKIAPPLVYPLGLMLAHDYIGPRTALLGEAAHIIHPLAGQGYNLTLRDGAQLADCFYDARRLGLDVGAPTTLDTYQRLRMRDAQAMAGVTHAFATFFSNEAGFLSPLRKLMFGFANKLPLIGGGARYVADTGLSVSPRLLPRLLRGEPFG